MVGPSGKFIEIGMPGSDCCICEGTGIDVSPYVQTQ